MLTSGGIQNTHYNLIDTLKHFMKFDWDWCYSIVTGCIKEKYTQRDFLNGSHGRGAPFIRQDSINMLCNDENLIENLSIYTAPIRYTIVEAIVWKYINTEIKEF